MKYPPASLTPFLPALRCIRRKMPMLNLQRKQKDLDRLDPLTLSISMPCALLNSLASLFATPLVCFQSFAVCPPQSGGRSFLKYRGWCIRRIRFPRVTSHGSPVTAFQQLTNCPLHTIDLHPPHFHSLTNPFFRNSRVFKNICVAPYFFPMAAKFSGCHLFARSTRSLCSLCLCGEFPGSFFRAIVSPS